MALIEPDQVNNFTDWRLLVERQRHERDKLEKIISEKRDAHAIYLKHYRKYKKLDQEQDEQVLKLMQMIPNK